MEFAPGKVYTTQDLPVLFENISAVTQIESRNIAGPKDTVETMAEEAIRLLFETLNIKAKHCGGLVLSGSTGNEARDHAMTLHAAAVAHTMGIKGPAVGVNFACSGYPKAVQHGLSLAEQTEKHILIVTSDIMSQLVDWNERSTAALFADRATATSLIPDGHTILEADAWEVDDPAEAIHLHKNMVMDIHGVSQSRLCISMNGRSLYAAAPGAMVDIMKDSMRRLGLCIEDIGAVVPHQANGKFMAKIKNILVEESADWGNVDIINEIKHRGNVGSSSIPAALSAVQDRLPKGKVVPCPTIGAGSDFKPGHQTEGILTFRVSEE